MSVPELVLDPQLRYWVLLPISIAMVIVGCLRIYITQYFNIKSQGNSKVDDLAKFQESSFLMRSKNFRQNNFILDQIGFESRQEELSMDLADLKYLANKASLQPAVPPPPGTEDLPEWLQQASQASPAVQDPQQMTNMMMQLFKSNLMNYIPQTVTMWWVNYFFAGYIIMKLPFPLTLQFKTMLQTGVMTQDLDVRWVSAISWYFVNLIGLKAIYSLLFDDANSIEAAITTTQGPSFGPAGFAGPGNPQIDKTMKKEAELIKILKFKSCLDDVEERVIKMYSGAAASGTGAEST